MKNVLPWLVCHQDGEGDIMRYTMNLECCTEGSSLIHLPNSFCSECRETGGKFYTHTCTQVYLPITSIKNYANGLCSILSRSVLHLRCSANPSSEKQLQRRAGGLDSSEASSPLQQKEKWAHPPLGDDLAHKSYIFQGAVIKQDQQIKVCYVFKCSSNEIEI